MFPPQNQVLKAVTDDPYIYYRGKVTVLFHGLVCVFHRWFRQHEYIEKLNMQAILNASATHDEFVKDLLVSHGKVRPGLLVGPFR